ncbi:hypothetical protein DB459_06415 [Bradyrhizobium sp. WD16]|nr:hypothetical protein DB459_06415 [Bradyrhizobium sp. WD16]
MRRGGWARARGGPGRRARRPFRPARRTGSPGRRQGRGRAMTTEGSDASVLSPNYRFICLTLAR